MKYDVFISHASEDTEAVARPLAAMLKSFGLRTWLDEHELTVGDNLRRSIDIGLSESQFGVVVLSYFFFNKEWPQRELDALASREDGKHKLILPVWHNIDRTDVLKYSPLLADRLAASTSDGLESVAGAIHRAIQQARGSTTAQAMAGLVSRVFGRSKIVEHPVEGDPGAIILETAIALKNEEMAGNILRQAVEKLEKFPFPYPTKQSTPSRRHSMNSAEMRSNTDVEAKTTW